MSMRFSHRTTVSTPKLASFWQEKHGMAIILVQGFAKRCLVKTSQEHGTSFGIFQSAKRCSYQQ